VLAPLYKLSPEYPLSNDVKITNRFVSPEQLIDYQDLEVMDNVHFYAPVFDYVPPELITLFVFNM
jgi:translation initiation factor eIF-2B subunit beta